MPIYSDNHNFGIILDRVGYRIHRNRKAVYFFMLQTKFVYGTDLVDLNQSLNKALSEINSEKVNVQYFLDKYIAIIEYGIEEEYKKEICCDCAYWDDSHNTNNLIGLCQLCGKRKRFSDKACPSYLDKRA